MKNTVLYTIIIMLTGFSLPVKAVDKVGLYCTGKLTFLTTKDNNWSDEPVVVNIEGDELTLNFVLGTILIPMKTFPYKYTFLKDKNLPKHIGDKTISGKIDRISGKLEWYIMSNKQSANGSRSVSHSYEGICAKAKKVLF